MKKLTLILFSLAIVLFCSEAKAQNSQSSTISSKDEYWGTAKATPAAASVDAVGRRAEGLDTRFNAYENDNSRKKFDKKKIARSKRMKEILKKEEKMMKKHRRDKRRLRRSQ